jgi:TolA-binding protein
MAVEKITKKQLKEDEFVNFFAKTILYFQAHKQEVGIGVLVLLIGAAIFGGFYFYRRSFDDQAFYQMSQALEVYHKAAPTTSDNNIKQAQELLEKVIKLHPSSPAAEEAQYYLGNCYFQMGDYDKALGVYENYLKKHSSGRFAPMAQEGRAQSWVAKKDMINAAKEYENLIKTYDSYPLLAEVLMTLGQLYEQMNNPQEALKTYKSVIHKFPESQEKVQAQRKIDILTKG